LSNRTDKPAKSTLIRNLQAQRSDLGFESTKPVDNLVRLLAVRRLLRANRPQHVQEEIGVLVAHDASVQPICP
jgi:hypothetical protein